jgi:hypothetical protein
MHIFFGFDFVAFGLVLGGTGLALEVLGERQQYEHDHERACNANERGLNSLNGDLGHR